jgi:hypothetical protein
MNKLPIIISMEQKNYTVKTGPNKGTTVVLISPKPQK